MAHMIDETTGQAAIAYAGATPWHALGRKMTDAERRDLPAAMTRAGIDWHVKTVILNYLDAQGNDQKVTDAQGIIRTDTGRYLATVGSSYTPVQNHEACSILGGLIDRGCTIEVMAALDGGKRAFALCRMPDATIQPVPGDDVRGYVLVQWSHDGSSGVRAICTPIRVVCQNTLSMALGGKFCTVVSIRHTASAPDRVKTAAHILDQFHEAMIAQGETYASMARKTMRPADIAAFIQEIIPGDKDAEKLSDTIKARREEIARLIFDGHHADQGGADSTTGQASAWRVYNAVTEYFDHNRAKEAKSLSARTSAYDSALFGGNALIKAQALRVLVAA